MLVFVLVEYPPAAKTNEPLQNAWCPRLAFVALDALDSDPVAYVYL